MPGSYNDPNFTGAPPGYTWAGSPPQAIDPFSTFGTNLINRYDMVQNKSQVEQYNQLTTPPPQMSQMMQGRIATGSNYQFGVMGGQVANFTDYITRSQMAANAAMIQGGMMAVSTPFFMIADQITRSAMTRAGFGALGAGAGGLAAGMAFTTPFMALGNTAQQRMQERMDIARDIMQYMPRFTAGYGVTRGEAKEMARGLYERFEQPGQFFGAEDQTRIFKMGLSSGMLKGRTTDEFTKNVDTLVKTTKDIVIALNTTIEGAMSMMNDLNNAGIKSPAQMSQMVMQAKAMGNITGLSSQNMLSIAGAGAQAVMGTGWAPISGAQAYMGMAGQLSAMAMRNPYLASAYGPIQQLGGLPQASASIAGSMMNFLHSGMGLQTMGYLLDPKTQQINMERLANLESGGVSAGQIVAGASNYGLSGPLGGAENRMLARLRFMRGYNKMGFEDQMGVMKGAYQSWATQSGMGGRVTEANAYAFAQQFAANEPQAELLQQVVMSPMYRETTRSGQMITGYEMRMAQYKPWMNPLSRAVQTMGRGALKAWRGAADVTGDLAQDLVRSGTGAVNWAASQLGSTPFFDTYRGAPAASAAVSAYGLPTISEDEWRAYRIAQTNKISAPGRVDYISRLRSMQGGASLDTLADRIITNTNAGRGQELVDMLVATRGNYNNVVGNQKLMNMLSSAAGTSMRFAFDKAASSEVMINAMLQKAQMVSKEYEAAPTPKYYSAAESVIGNTYLAAARSGMTPQEYFTANPSKSFDLKTDRYIKSQVGLAKPFSVPYITGGGSSIYKYKEKETSTVKFLLRQVLGGDIRTDENIVDFLNKTGGDITKIAAEAPRWTGGAMTSRQLGYLDDLQKFNTRSPGKLKAATSDLLDESLYKVSANVTEKLSRYGAMYKEVYSDPVRGKDRVSENLIDRIMSGAANASDISEFRKTSMWREKNLTGTDLTSIRQQLAVSSAVEPTRNEVLSKKFEELLTKLTEQITLSNKEKKSPEEEARLSQIREEEKKAGRSLSAQTSDIKNILDAAGLSSTLGTGLAGQQTTPNVLNYWNAQWAI